MKNPAFSLILIPSLAFVFFSCKEVKVSEGVPSSVFLADSKSSGTLSVSDIFEFKGYTTLESNRGDLNVRSVKKLLFANDEKIIAVDNGTDFQNIWLFDKTGKFLNKIGLQNEQRSDAFEGLNNVSYDKKQNEVICLSSGKKSFVTYGPDGAFHSSVLNGVFGDDMIVSPDDKMPYIVYNEYNPSHISGNYHLLFFSREGDLVQRAFEYADKKNGSGYEMCGFVNQSAGSNWFSPPFCDTIFTITNGQVSPRYVINFGQVRPRMDSKDAMVNQLPEIPYYLGSTFVKIGAYCIFDFVADNKVQTGLLDDKNNKLLKLSETNKNDPFYPILQLGYFYPKDNSTFAMMLRPSRVRYLVSHNLLDMDYFKKNYPQLAEIMEHYSQDDNPLILYFSLKKQA